MVIKQIDLTHFRLYDKAHLEPCPGITVLHGDNAQGKTAILEAVYLCCTGRSHRTLKDKEMILWGQNEARVQVVTERSDGKHDVRMDLFRDAHRITNVNGSPIGRSGELLGHVTGVLFSPEDLRMVKDGPAERRRFIDMELSQISTAYYYALQRYNRALNQRGKLLKEIAVNPSLLSTLEDWDVQLAGAGARIVEMRRDFVERISHHAAAIHAEITGGGEKLEARYQRYGFSGTAFDVDVDDAGQGKKKDKEQQGTALEQEILESLFKNRETDLRRGFTGVGPHRDDLAILIDGIDARTYGSQGQQRSCALSMKLSELSVMHECTGEYPVLMLDDVMSELDPKRRRHLLGAMKGVQILVTCTDPEDLAGADAGEMVRIRKGEIVLPEKSAKRLKETEDFSGLSPEITAGKAVPGMDAVGNSVKDGVGNTVDDTDEDTALDMDTKLKEYPQDPSSTEFEDWLNGV